MQWMKKQKHRQQKNACLVAMVGRLHSRFAAASHGWRALRAGE